jgi:7-cyano-7-deazaguanine synthase
MCGINGAFYYDSQPDEQQLREILVRCADRGDASCGVVAWSPEHWCDTRVLGGPENLPEHFLPQGTRIVINNNRAEPTTEWVMSKHSTDIQPFRTERFAVSHNGIIANDVTLREQHAITVETSIDSAVLPQLIERLGVRAALAQLEGGVALAIIDAQHGALHLYRNFLPISLVWRPGVFYFSSEAKNLPGHGRTDAFRVEQLPPYSGVTIESSGRLFRWT